MRYRLSAAAPFGIGFTVTLIAAGVSLTNVPLDWDEGATLSAATRSPGELFDLAGYKDAVIAPYYLVLLVFLKVVGASDAALRLPSLVAMALGAGVTAELARRMVSQAAGIVAGVICAALPSLMFFANTARPYAFAFLFATLSSLLLLIAVRSPRWPYWAAYGLCLALTGIFHLVALSVLSAHVLILAIAWWKERDKRLWRAFAAFAVALAAVVPLALLGRQQRYSQLHWVKTPTWETLVTLPGEIAYSPAVGYLLVGLAIAAYAALPSRVYAELVALVAVPVAVVLGVSLIAPVWVPRYGIFLLAPLAVLAAATVTSEHVRSVAAPRFARAGAIAAVLVFLSLPAQISLRSTHKAPDTRAMAAAIHTHAAKGDVIVYTDFAWTMRPTLTHYLSRLEWTQTAQPPDILMKHSAAANGTLEATEFQDIQGRLANAHRIWLVGPAAGVYGAPEDPLSAPGWKIKYIQQHYQLHESYTFEAGRAVLLVARTAPAPAADYRGGHAGSLEPQALSG
ncbi:glycosyltransferase family 39 protein [Allorhizocola rhizosphaerae]|uniref:glycosyltransferase family 39 protein n=1 Tax=Allorhizocola rhizosphaerae TaxID=1872709 RepID=UPI0013C32C2F|nr:glycosyltransferase family 39 protein [Allorhizocola rhizosphaerae]